MRGGYGTSDHGTLADRGPAAQTSAARLPAARTPTPGPASPARHCRVDDQPSLLVEWRRAGQGWEGRVLSVLWLDAVGWATVERWLPAEAIER